jgi:hypothetical protein
MCQKRSLRTRVSRGPTDRLSRHGVLIVAKVLIYSVAKLGMIREGRKRGVAADAQGHPSRQPGATFRYHFTGTNTGAPLSLTKNTTNLAGLLLLAFRPTT